MTQSAQARRWNAQRGFVLVVVLMVMAALAVSVALQSNVAVSDRTAAVRVRSETRARAIAESCLEAAISEARERANNMAGFQDFDDFLDPSALAAGTYDTASFLPPTPVGRRTVVPASAATGGEREALHQYRVRPMQGGACLLRYDDNQDDSLPDLGLSTRELAGVDEGDPDLPNNGTTNIPNRDRDRSIIVTAIGIHPFTDNVANDATAYERAASRVTVKALLQSEIQTSTVGEVGLWVGGNLSHGSDNRTLSVCGAMGTTHIVGGVSGPSGVTKKCTCGVDKGTNGIGQACSSSNCTVPTWWSMTPPNPGTCAAYSRDSSPASSPIAPGDGYVPPPATPPPPVPYSPPAIPAMGDPHLNIAKVGNTLSDDTCEWWFDSSRSDVQVFVFDHADADTTTNIPLQGGVAPVYTDARLTENCTALGTAFPEPCDWKLAAVAPPLNLPTGLATCAAGQSACWKPVAKLNGADRQSFGGGREATQQANEHISAENGDGVPFSAQTYQSLCGVMTNSNAADNDGPYFSSPSWKLGDLIQSDEFPRDRGAYWIFNEPAGRNVLLDKAIVGDSDGMFELGILSNVPVTFAERIDAVSPSYRQSGPLPAYPNGPPDNLVTSANWNTIEQPAANDSFLFAPGADCFFKKVDTIIGNITCRTVQIEKGDAGPKAIIGTIENTRFCNADGTCPGAPATPKWTDLANVCWHAAAGSCQKRPGICIKEDLNIQGNLEARGEIQIEKKTKVRNGTHVAALGTGARICIKGGSGGGSGSGYTAGNGVWLDLDTATGEIYAQADSPTAVMPGITTTTNHGFLLQDEDNVLRARNIRSPGMLYVDAKKNQMEGRVHVGSLDLRKEEFLVFGQLHVNGNANFEKKRVQIFNDASLATSTAVSQNVIWLEQSW